MRILICAFCLFFMACAKPNQMENIAAAEGQRGIVGGEPVDTNTDELYKHVVSIVDVHQNSICTGVLIKPKIVLTAAHCVARSTEAHNVFHHRKAEKFFGSSSVEAVIVHFEYRAPSKGKVSGVDLALLRLDQQPKGAEPIELLRDKELIKPGVILDVYGYGRTLGRFGENGSGRLNKVRREVSYTSQYFSFQYDQTDKRGI